MKTAEPSGDGDLEAVRGEDDLAVDRSIDLCAQGLEELHDAVVGHVLLVAGDDRVLRGDGGEERLGLRRRGRGAAP